LASLGLEEGAEVMGCDRPQIIVDLILLESRVVLLFPLRFRKFLEVGQVGKIGDDRRTRQVAEFLVKTGHVAGR